MPVPLLVPVLVGLAAALAADGADEEDGEDEDGDGPPEDEGDGEPEPWTFVIDDDAWTDLSKENQGVGWVRVDPADRTVTACKVLGRHSPVRFKDSHEQQVIEFPHFMSPLSGLDVRDWFEDREDDLEEIRFGEPAKGLLEEFQEALDAGDLHRVLPAEEAVEEWVASASRDEVVRDLISGLGMGSSSKGWSPEDILDVKTPGIVVRGGPAECWRACAGVLESWAESFDGVEEASVVDTDPDGLLRLMGNFPYRLELHLAPGRLQADPQVLLARLATRLFYGVFFSVDTDEDGERFLWVVLPWIEPSADGSP